MALPSLTGLGLGPVAGAGMQTPRSLAAPTFREVITQGAELQRPENSPTAAGGAPMRQPPAIEPCRQEASSSEPGPKLAGEVLERVAQAQRKMEHILQVAESGKSFSPAELLSLQANVYRASQELDLAGKVVEKATSGLKQILQTQV